MFVLIFLSFITTMLYLSGQVVPYKAIIKATFISKLFQLKTCLFVYFLLIQQIKDCKKCGCLMALVHYPASIYFVDSCRQSVQLLLHPPIHVVTHPPTHYFYNCDILKILHFIPLRAKRVGR